jgi:hypothetical protein
VKEKLVFTEGMSVESSKNQSVTSITQVQTKGRKTRSTIDMSRSNVAEDTIQSMIFYSPSLNVRPYFEVKSSSRRLGDKLISRVRKRDLHF